MEGHVEGMLDRDQRTAKLRICNCSRLLAANNTYSLQSSMQLETNQTSPISHCCLPRITSPRCSYLMKSGYFWTSIQKVLKQYLIVGVYLSFITFPEALSAPVKVNMSERLKGTPRWINPCQLDLSDSDSSMPQGTDDFTLTSQIVRQAEIALYNANRYKEDFAKGTFQVNADEVHKLFEHQKYSWLPTIPKRFGEDVPLEIKKQLEFDELLLDSYQFLQSIAVGFEQMVQDQIDRQGRFAKLFEETEHHLRSVLCELQMAIVEKNVKMRPDVTRDIMDDTFRTMDVTQSKTRDWIIYRDYINSLEYIVDSFKHLKDLLPK